MTLIAKNSLVPYNPAQEVLRYRSPGQMGLRADHGAAPFDRPTQPETGSLDDKPLRPLDPHSVYSARRTIEASRAAATGLVVDIFV
jgi:hypothetical protein